MSDTATAARRPRWGLRVLVAVLVIVAVAAVALAVAVRNRQEQERLGLGAVSAPGAPQEPDGPAGRTGAFTAQIDFTSMATGARTVPRRPSIWSPFAEATARSG